MVGTTLMAPMLLEEGTGSEPVSRPTEQSPAPHSASLSVYCGWLGPDMAESNVSVKLQDGEG